jgi:hypothetical protein
MLSRVKLQVYKEIPKAVRWKKTVARKVSKRSKDLPIKKCSWL